MYINNDEFEKWMEKLSSKLNEIGQDIRTLSGKGEVNILDENDKLLDNQDLAFFLKVSYRTLQRYRTNKKLPYFMIYSLRIGNRKIRINDMEIIR